MRDNRSASRTTRSASCCTTARIVGRGHRLRQQPERADRRLQLVTHVGDEVAAHTLDAPRLGDVAGERDRADHFAVAAERERAELEHLARRTVELELALRGDPFERGVQQLRHRVLGEHLAVPGAVEAASRRVAHDLTTDAVDDDDRVGRLVERGQQPVLHRFGARDPVGRLPGCSRQWHRRDRTSIRAARAWPREPGAVRRRRPLATRATTACDTLTRTGR